MKKVVLCADQECLSNPALLGLEGEKLDSYPWLVLFSDGVKARFELARSNEDIDEVWVVSSDNLDALNLAAGIKKDNPQQKIYLVTDNTSGSLLSRAKSAGITAALSQVAFVKRFGLAKSRTATSPGENSSTDSKAKAQAFVLVVASGSGGAGKSTITAMSALLAVSRGLKTLVIDADLQFGDLAGLLGRSKPLTAEAAIVTDKEGENPDLFYEQPSLIVPGTKLLDQEFFSQRLSSLIKKYQSQFDLIIVNTASGWNESHATLIELCSKTLLLIDQRASSIHATVRVLEICEQCGIPCSSFLFVLNHCSKAAPLSSIDVSCALKGAHVIELREGGFQVEECMGCGRASELIKTAPDFCLSIGSMLDELLPPSLAENTQLPKMHRSFRRWFQGSKTEKPSKGSSKLLTHVFEDKQPRTVGGDAR